ncbi:unnamed protein product [Bursaphelenchus okinawaensis]|uniref:Uncharacterized protein n=1 Tax=Bursaphelenchus okinawaensis TaxID=465554 RepID=A0A811K7I6_9BILA|nr:unnamed protein product [Bursaphelenchus okinawaensis]CAG9094099.1 unnamed protein product [Bursaphelenchus okinawaensis]
MRRKAVYLFDSYGYRRTRISVKTRALVSELITEVCVLTQWHFHQDCIKQIRVPDKTLPEGFRRLKTTDFITNEMDNFEIVMDFGNNIQIFIYDENYRLMFQEFVIFNSSSQANLLKLLCDLHPQRLQPDRFLFMDSFCNGGFDVMSADNNIIKPNSIVSIVFMVSNERSASVTPCLTVPTALTRYLYNLEPSFNTKLQNWIDQSSFDQNYAEELAKTVGLALTEYHFRREPLKIEREVFLKYLFLKASVKCNDRVFTQLMLVLEQLCSLWHRQRRDRFSRLLNHQIRVMNQPIDEGPLITFKVFDCSGRSECTVTFNRPSYYNLFKCLTILCTKMSSSFESDSIHRIGIFHKGNMFDVTPEDVVRAEYEYFIQFKDRMIRCVIYDENYKFIFSAAFPFTGCSVEELLFLTQLKAEGQIRLDKLIRIEGVKTNGEIKALNRYHVPFGFSYMFIQMRDADSSIMDANAEFSPSNMFPNLTVDNIVNEFPVCMSFKTNATSGIDLSTEDSKLHVVDAISERLATAFRTRMPTLEETGTFLQWIFRYYSDVKAVLALEMANNLPASLASRILPVVAGIMKENEVKRYSFINKYMSEAVVVESNSVVNRAHNGESENLDESAGSLSLNTSEFVSQLDAQKNKDTVVYCISHEFIVIERFTLSSRVTASEVKTYICEKLHCNIGNIIDVKVAHETAYEVCVRPTNVKSAVGKGSVAIAVIYTGESEYIATADDMLEELPLPLRNKSLFEMLKYRSSAEEAREIIDVLEKGAVMEKRLRQIVVRTVVSEISSIVFGRRPRTKEYTLFLDTFLKQYGLFDQKQLFEYEGAGWGHPFLHSGNSIYQARQKSFLRAVQSVIGASKHVTTPNVRRSRVYAPRKRKADSTSSPFYCEVAEVLLHIVDQVVQNEELETCQLLSDMASSLYQPGSQEDTTTKKPHLKFNYSIPNA